ncbi:curli production assembly/transport protein CsgE [Shewanella sp. AS1]|uniref:curli production assembly/transport protein CsgE n=1 Tax=Shewanella sp. AS1 TaxID=2907626 RepID=UPI001F25F150|nr:curli production assembly/transport protein CsgE [Shewanella sp. AS1]MCE9678936.1 curli production assembly/transport protein CsgE [Shewanella sp. AS1]
MKFIGWFFLLTLFALPSLVAAEGEKSAPFASQNVSDHAPKQESDLIDGLILNRAMTRFGHRFYRQFVAAYRDIGGITTHSGLSVVERATARSGSKISILHNRRPIFVTIVSPASRHLDKQAELAAARVNQLLIQAQQQAGLVQWLDPDLAEDEF